MTLRRTFALLLASACGSVSPTPSADVDASTSTPDTSAPPADSTAATTWTTPTLIPGVSAVNAGDALPTLRADLCEMYFASDRDGNQDIYVTTRFTPSDPWGTPVRVAELSGSSTDSGPELAPDGSAIWIARNTAANSYEIVVAHRNSPADPWSTPVVVPELSSPLAERAPQITADGRTIFFVRDNGTNGTKELWTATRTTSSSTWTNLHEVNKLNSTFDEENPTTTADGLEIYFDTTRGDGSTYAVYRSAKPDGGAWDVPARVPELDGTLGAEISGDGHYMVMAMVGTDLRTDLYESHRP